MRSARILTGLGTALAVAAGVLAAGGTAVAEPLRSVAPAPAAATDAWWPPQPPSTLVIDTAGTAIGRDDYVEGTVTLDGTTHATEVRGRGNSTWGWPKKPYKLKLAEDAALLGTREYDEWVLLANYADRSALRTATAFTLARQTRLLWTPRFRFVDVVINGTSQGLYMLTEQVEEGNGRVELPEDGHLLEINQRYLRDDEPGFRTGHGTAVAFKDPDEVTKAQRRLVRGAVTRFEKVLYGKDFADPKTGYAAYIDTRKLIDWYLVEELFGNQDSNFQSSVNFTWSPGKRFEFGPVWDFDISAGTRWRAQSQPDVWHTREGDHWIARMLEDPKFSARVKRRWAGLRPTVDRLIAQIPSAAAPLAASAAADWQQWHLSGDLPWTAHGATYGEEVDHLARWLRLRAAWLSNNEARLGLTRVRTEERDRTVYVPVELQDAPSSPLTIDYATVSGTATAGVDFVDATGQLTFAAGQQVRYIPVRILPDTSAEGRENFEVRLLGSSGAVIGSPHAATVIIRPNE